MSSEWNDGGSNRRWRETERRLTQRRPTEGRPTERRALTRVNRNYAEERIRLTVNAVMTYPAIMASGRAGPPTGQSLRTFFSRSFFSYFGMDVFGGLWRYSLQTLSLRDGLYGPLRDTGILGS